MAKLNPINAKLKQHIVDKYRYDSKTGILWKIFSNKCSMVGASSHGYLICKILGKSFSVHHLCWFLYYGQFPINEIDHINRSGADNRITNLREATRGQNQANSGIQSKTRQYKGISKHRNGWQVYCNGQYIGWYKNPIDAAKAYDDVARQLFGEFACTNEKMKLL